MDQKVLDAQKWVNATYGGVAGYERCDEDGSTSWDVMYSLTMGLQHELGISPVAANFGDGTYAKVAALGDVTASRNKNIIKIIQHALFCKGYWAGDVDGNWLVESQQAAAELKNNMGVDNSTSSQLFVKHIKALLTMDAYVLLSGGREEVRTIQRWLNSTYVQRSSFFIIPCDGHYTRDVQTALLKAIQYELGVPDDQATGYFGEGTKAGLRRNTIEPGSPAAWIRLFSAACVFNSPFFLFPNEWYATFTSSWTEGLGNWLRKFQEFSHIDPNGRGDFTTWAQLLVSTGDPDRKVTACDTRYHITASRSRALKNAGYVVVGRYLHEPPESTLDKEIQPGELQDIFSSGLRVFPIWQWNGRRLGDFTWSTGYDQGIMAHERASDVYKFNRGTTIYFAVDYDATTADINSNIIPYFQGVNAALKNRGKKYVIGVYGSRNVCSRVSAAVGARHSFVSGMSWGFSGNLGFSNPNNWSFNQIKEFKFNNSGDVFDLDNDVYRGTDIGCGPENVDKPGSPVDAFLGFMDRLYAAAVAYHNGDERYANLRVMEFLRVQAYNSIPWDVLAGGGVSEDWIEFVANRIPRTEWIFGCQEPSFGVNFDAPHFGAAASLGHIWGLGPGNLFSRGDFAGWAGDLVSFYGSWRRFDEEYASGYQYCTDRLMKVNVDSPYKLEDIVADADAVIMLDAIKRGAKINEALRAHLTGNGHVNRFRTFYNLRFGGSLANVAEAARNALIPKTAQNDPVMEGMHEGVVYDDAGGPAVLPKHLPAYKLDPFIQGFVDTIDRLVRG
ncbi:DUF1906 domain-containing protein [Lentzea tibetensis]|uniref:DUF1906 domain-containing protein n=1 Tax=Lentzea tibetensis TaxID=2591470 RepID=A0A563EZI8_9PSEU|nr:glycoside hydrolase domain-containing protein [Lentzea tibetensis]TWP52901.1 DUF1906 domain-containing protein [Lentzea tibetensis]